MRCAVLAAVAALALAPTARGADIFVDAAIGSDASAGLSWGAPKATALAALADAALTPEPDVISVAAGVYLGDIDVPPDVTLLGGFASGGATRDIATYRTTLMGEGDGPVVMFGAGTDACVLDGFVVTGGWSDFRNVPSPRPDPQEQAGGIAIADASPLIRNCLVQGNDGAAGGGIYAVGSRARIEDCVIQGNAGLGIMARLRYGPVQSGQVVLERSIIRANFGYGYGGVYVSLPPAPGAVLMRDCRVTDNAAVGDPFRRFSALTIDSVGAAETPRSLVENCVFTSNGDTALLLLAASTVNDLEAPGCEFRNCLVAGSWSRGIATVSAHVSHRFTNCTIMGGDFLFFWQGGIAGSAPYALEVERSIVSTSRSSVGAPFVSISDTLIMDSSRWSVVTNVINADPLFVPGPAHEYYLSDVSSGQAATSPAIDQGPVTAADAGLDGCTTRTDGGADSGLVDWGYHDCGIIAGGPWADEPAPPTLEIWRGQADAPSLWSVTTRLPWFEQRDTAPDTVSAGALLFYDVRGAVAPIHVARTPENASVVLTY